MDSGLTSTMARILFGAAFGFAAHYLTFAVEKNAVKLRTGQEITWTKECGEVIEPKVSKLERFIPAICTIFGAASAWFAESYIDFIYLVAMMTVLCAASLTDFKYRIIPNEVVLTVILLRIPMIILYPDGSILRTLISSVIGAVGIYLLVMLGYLIKPGAIGYGDIKLLIAFGFSLGFVGVASVLFLAGITTVIPMLLPVFFFSAQGLLKRLNSMVPLGPPLSLAMMVVLYLYRTPFKEFFTVFGSI